MAAYEYTAIDGSGKKAKGIITADSPRAARKELRIKDLMPTDIQPLSEKRASGTKTRKSISDKDRSLLTRQLAVLLQSGMTVEQALGAAAQDASNPSISAILHKVRADVTEGARFADALGNAPRAFPPLYKAVVASGEMSGRQGDVLERLATYLENTWRLKQKVRSALIYPALLASLALGMVVLLMWFVVPKLIEQFDTFDAQLPWITRAVIGVSNGLRSYGWLILPAILIIGFLGHKMLTTPAASALKDRQILKLPIIGNLARTVSAARFCRIFATLSASGATVLECLQASRGAMTNSIFRDATDQISEHVQEGGSLAVAVKKTGVFPTMMVHMVASGEAGRDIPGMMGRAADFLEDEFETATSTALSLMEPLIILFLGLLVGVIVLSIMLPIIQLNTMAMR